jgi:beta-N-acetylhexosaminidase
VSLGPLLVDVEGLALTAEDRELLLHPLVGGVILFARNYQGDRTQLEALVAEIHALRSPQLLVTVDHEGGRVQRFREGFTVLPPARSFGQLYDRDPKQALQLTELSSWLLAAELRAVGIDLSFAAVSSATGPCTAMLLQWRNWHAAGCWACVVPAWRPAPSISPAMERCRAILT